MSILSIKENILKGNQISFDEAIELYKSQDKELLYKSAGEIRDTFAGKKFDTCSILNARSGKCSENCKWCSQSVHHNTNIEVYDVISSKEALEVAKQNDNYGVNRFSLVTSGRALDNMRLDKLLKVYDDIRSNTKLHMCASMGLLNRDQLQKLKDRGVEHYHCNLETARSFFPNLCSTHTYDEKVETIKMAQEVGLKVCSGGIMGMGETMEQRIEMAFELKQIGVKSIPLNILNPIEGTPMEGTTPLTDDEVLTTIALFRFINPDANLRFAGGRNIIKHIEDKAMQAGINSALVGDLLTTIGSDVKTDFKKFEAAGFSLEKNK
ncbi:MAG: biotin synthase BioB [Bacteroidales bacterium]|nr:biotin synthase BioB [Bacteroidales bacterium]